MNYKFLSKKSEEIRRKVIDYHKKTKIAHLGSDLSCVEIMTTLHYSVMEEQDKFVLSKGHASGILYLIINDKGRIPEKEMYSLEEHPTLNQNYGIELTTGSLGHGLSVGIGMCIADKENKVYVLMGDGECDEGQVWEAARAASELNVQNLVALVDCNGFQGFRKSNHLSLDEKFRAFGWETIRCDGHDCKQLFDAITKPHNLPLVVLATTVKGKGIPDLENKLKSHYACE